MRDHHSRIIGLPVIFYRLHGIARYCPERHQVIHHEILHYGEGDGKIEPKQKRTILR